MWTCRPLGTVTSTHRGISSTERKLPVNGMPHIDTGSSKAKPFRSISASFSSLQKIDITLPALILQHGAIFPLLDCNRQKFVSQVSEAIPRHNPFRKYILAVRPHRSKADFDPIYFLPSAEIGPAHILPLRQKGHACCSYILVNASITATLRG